MGYPAALQVRRTMVRATSLTDWCFFSTVSLFLNEIKYKGKLPSFWIKKGTNAISYAKYWTELPNKGGEWLLASPSWSFDRSSLILSIYIFQGRERTIALRGGEFFLFNFIALLSYYIVSRSVNSYRKKGLCGETPSKKRALPEYESSVRFYPKDWNNLLPYPLG